MDRLARRIKAYSMVLAAIISAAGLLVLVPVCIVFKAAIPALVIIPGALLIFLFGYLPLYINLRNLERTKTRIRFSRGVFYRRCTTLPNTAILTTSKTITPLMRLFKIELVCFRYASGSLWFLDEIESDEE